MSTSSIDAKMFSQMFLAAAYNLKSNKEWINELNVFPVPDGDTGTNMTMTITSAVRELEGLGDDFDMMSLCKSISSGSLRGARGNSGVILSQLLRGFCKAVRDHAEIDVPAAAAGMDKAVETAYKAVMKPKEGTILTVAKGVAEKSRELVNAGETDIDKYLTEVIEYGDQVLASTPDMLPVLKQAGVSRRKKLRKRSGRPRVKFRNSLPMKALNMATAPSSSSCLTGRLISGIRRRKKILSISSIPSVIQRSARGTITKVWSK